MTQKMDQSCDDLQINVHATHYMTVSYFFMNQQLSFRTALWVVMNTIITQTQVYSAMIKNMTQDILCGKLS